MFALVRFRSARRFSNDFEIIRRTYPTVDEAELEIERCTDNGMYCVIDLRCVKDSLVDENKIKASADYDEVMQVVSDYWSFGDHKTQSGFASLSGRQVQYLSGSTTITRSGTFITDSFARLRFVTKQKNTVFYIYGVCVWSSFWPNTEPT